MSRFTLNLDFFNSVSYPYTNIFKVGSMPASDANATCFVSNIDANNYPKSGTLSNTIVCNCPFPTFYGDTSTVWVLAWEGNMGSNVNPGFQLTGTGYSVQSTVKGGVSGATTSNLNVYSTGGTGGYITFKWANVKSGSTLSFSFLAGATFDGTLSNLRLYRLAHESGGTIPTFNPDFITKLTELNPSILRFLDWNIANYSMLMDSAYMPSTSLFCYGTNYIPSIYCGDITLTTGNGDLYSASLGGVSSLTHGLTVQARFPSATLPHGAAVTAGSYSGGQITFTVGADLTTYIQAGSIVNVNSTGNANYNGDWTVVSVSATQVVVTSGSNPGTFSGSGAMSFMRFNLNSLGSKPLKRTSAGAAWYTGELSAGKVLTLTYDADLQIWMYQQSGVGGAGPLQAGVPLDDMIALCNQTSTDMWINIPAAAGDNLVTAMATSIQANLNGACYWEYSNETWNTQFTQYGYTNAKAVVAGIGGTSSQRQNDGWTGYRFRQVAELLKNAYGYHGYAAAGVQKRYYRVLAHASAATSTGNLSTYRMGGSDLSSFGYSSAPNRPVDWAEAAAYAVYLCGAQTSDLSSNYANSITTGGPNGNTVGLYGAAGEYALGDTANKTLALDWMDWDFRQGTRSGSNGSSTLNVYNASKNVGAGAIGVYPSYEGVYATFDNGNRTLIAMMYEGAMQAVYPTASKLTSMQGSDAAITDPSGYGDASGKINTLLTAYKNDIRFLWYCMDQFKQFVAGHSGRTAIPSWYRITGNDAWGLYTDLYATAYQSKDAVRLYNNNKRRFKVVGS